MSIWKHVRGLMYGNLDKNRENYAKCLPLFKISLIYAWNITPFSWFREFAPTWKITSFFAKVGASMVYIFIGSGGAGLTSWLQEKISKQRN